MMNELEDAIAQKGHNNPPSDAEILSQRLVEKNKDVILRFADLLSAEARLPEKIENSEQAQKVTSYGSQLKACMSNLEMRRKEEKKPYDDLASVAHQFFMSRITSLDGVVAKVKAKLKAFDDIERKRLADEAEAQRKRDAEAADAQRKEAERLANEAAALEQAGMTRAAETIMQQAAKTEEAAIQAASIAAAPVAPVKNTMRGSVGGSASSQSRWDIKVTDINAIDLNLLHDHFGRAEIEKALRSLMRAEVKKLGPQDKPRAFAGFEIIRESSISLRQ